MKNPSKLLVAAVFGAALSLSAFAGPGFQYWQNRDAAKPASAVTKPADSAKCPTMTVAPDKITRDNKLATTVTCTPEMMQNNARCKAACGM